MSPSRFKDHHRESRTFQIRAVIAFILVIIALFGLVSRFYFLQVTEHDRFTALSDKNRIQLQPVAPTRGLIYDRNGVLLADNQPSYSVTLLKEELQDLDGTLIRLQELIPITDRQIERFRKRLKQRRRPFESVPLRFRLTEQEIARISVNYHRLPGVRVEADLIRYYPYGSSLVHALGYVGRINERELQKVDETNYSATHYIGKLGVEKYYEAELHGDVGFQKVETNARGRIMRVVERSDPVPGKDLVMSLDLKLQQVTEKLLDGRRAAVVAIDPNDGGILALVSTPGYDPNLFVTGISNKDYGALRESDDLPLFNRALRGRYPPGSTVKPIIALAAIDSESVSPAFKVSDPGWFTLTNGGRKYRDWKRGGHGTVGLNLALAQSCDVWFYSAGHKMGIDPMSEYLGYFGFGSIESLDLPEATRGILPSREWKRNSRRLPWYPGDSLNLSIGQGFLLSTPMQLATATAVIANRGRWVQPRMLKGVYQADEEGFTTTDLNHDYGRSKPDDVKLKHPEYWDTIIQGMVDVVHGPRGTARLSAQGAQYRFAGKTGTAQVVGIKQDEEYDAEKLAERLRDHALFVAFAPVENPQIAVAVIVENGGGGSTTAAPIARKVMDAYLVGEEAVKETEIESLMGYEHD
ncbi:penicillin-binding protein 2 [Pontibacterium sp. N1Y112]|uniref:Peptidoglycan D,D-transpeptidase MrdA n=1 Tax=Pontibacterium sinense TaxID=2781979 RepID=A0A8J7F6I3_9GAMM|nr:penicillin-binding protein 2 [Pontibacterium sinense]MBE9395995.1 penicillin-binding protein 2 [Pontibacterium sinense]